MNAETTFSLRDLVDGVARMKNPFPLIQILRTIDHRLFYPIIVFREHLIAALPVGYTWRAVPFHSGAVYGVAYEAAKIDTLDDPIGNPDRESYKYILNEYIPAAR